MTKKTLGDSPKLPLGLSGNKNRIFLGGNLALVEQYINKMYQLIEGNKSKIERVVFKDTIERT